MTQQISAAKPTGRHTSVGHQARALRIVLREEFDTPFALYDAASGTLLGKEGGEATSDGAEVFTPPALLPPAEVHEAVADGRARVTRLPDGCYRLMLVLYQSGKPILVGVGELDGLGGPANREQERLRRWLQAVSDRLRLTDQPLRQRPDAAGPQPVASVEALLALDNLLGRLRIHKEADRNKRRILDAAFGLLDVQAVMWVPQDSGQPVVIQGETCLAPADCRQLAALLARSPDVQASAPLLCNQVQTTSWGAHFPRLVSLLALHVNDAAFAGWVIAVNKGVHARGQGTGARGQEGETAVPCPPSAVPSTEFRRSDAAVLAPFVSVLELYLRASGRYQELKDLLVGLTRSLTSALDAKDPYTYGHSERVARIAIEIARELGLGEDELGDIYLAGLLHDVGKIGIHDAVLAKEGALTPEEFNHIKQHVVIGYTILSELRQIRNLLPGVLYHHERYDGGGYPDGLEGEAIPLMARILAVADAYDAMSTSRPYRDALPLRRVEEILRAGMGEQWDARVVEAFQRCRQKVHAIRQRGVGDSLRLAIDGALRSVVANQ